MPAAAFLLIWAVETGVGPLGASAGQQTETLTEAREALEAVAAVVLVKGMTDFLVATGATAVLGPVAGRASSPILLGVEAHQETRESSEA